MLPQIIMLFSSFEPTFWNISFQLSAQDLNSKQYNRCWWRMFVSNSRSWWQIWWFDHQHPLPPSSHQHNCYHKTWILIFSGNWLVLMSCRPIRYKSFDVDRDFIYFERDFGRPELNELVSEYWFLFKCWQPTISLSHRLWLTESQQPLRNRL